MMIGYAHVSPKGQNLEQQRAALGAIGCVRIFEDDDPEAPPHRPELTRILDHLRAGDVVIVTLRASQPKARRAGFLLLLIALTQGSVPCCNGPGWFRPGSTRPEPDEGSPRLLPSRSPSTLRCALDLAANSNAGRDRFVGESARFAFVASAI